MYNYTISDSIDVKLYQVV